MINTIVASCWPRCTMLAGATALALTFQATPASAAVVEWQLGPINVTQARPADIAIANLESFSCEVAVVFFEGRPRDAGTPFDLDRVFGSVGDKKTLKPRQVVTFLIGASIEPGDLLVARVVADCPTATREQARRLSVTLQIVGDGFRPLLALPGIFEVR